MDGRKLLGIVKRLLQRENRWIAWKNNACTAFERSPGDIRTLGDSSVDVDFISSILICLFFETKGKEGVNLASMEAKESSASFRSYTTRTLKSSRGNNRPSQPSQTTMTTKRFDTSASYLFDYSAGKIEEIAKQLASGVPDFDEEIQVH